MKQRIIAAMLTICCAGAARAQQAPGQLEAGVRVGLPLGVTGRYFFNEHNAVEGIVGLYNRTASLTALYQYHWDLSALTFPGFGWYAGGGAHLGTRRIDGSSKFLAGVDAIAGVNYEFEKIPLNLSLDWKPAIHFTTSSELADFGVSARYIFGRKK
ncbi:hypothetical protein EGT74_18750 [Chitinophaga lutea]|uniref:Outer membrane protein beta-barrel domain-containing protein n=1 Tax=Chitinophaga lutea TaxID=2488634 RepID=A0A3N4PN76_9BACT|nr:hypothetical protein [Chitinophaga lutea]RPE09048.1 hypothetical protein EGT74_18750 [Chitinophaga lutea]